MGQEQEAQAAAEYLAATTNEERKLVVERVMASGSSVSRFLFNTVPSFDQHPQ